MVVFRDFDSVNHPEFDRVVDPVADWGVDDSGSTAVQSTIENNVSGGDLVVFPEPASYYRYTGSVTVNAGGGSPIGFISAGAWNNGNWNDVDKTDPNASYGYYDNSLYEFRPTDATSTRLFQIQDDRDCIVEGFIINAGDGDGYGGVAMNNGNGYGEIRNIEETGRGIPSDEQNDVPEFLQFRHGGANSIWCHRVINHEASDPSWYAGGRHGLLDGNADPDSDWHIIGCEMSDFGNNALYCNHADNTMEVVGGHYYNNNVSSLRLGFTKEARDVLVEIDGSMYDGRDPQYTSTNWAYRGFWSFNPNLDEATFDGPTVLDGCRFNVRNAVDDGAGNFAGVPAAVEHTYHNRTIDIRDCNFDVDIDQFCPVIEHQARSTGARGIRVKDCTIINAGNGGASLLDITDAEDSAGNWTPETLITGCCFQSTDGSSIGVDLDSDNRTYSAEISDTNINVASGTEYAAEAGVSLSTSNFTTSGECSIGDIEITTLDPDKTVGGIRDIELRGELTSLDTTEFSSADVEFVWRERGAGDTVEDAGNVSTEGGVFTVTITVANDAWYSYEAKGSGVP